MLNYYEYKDVKVSIAHRLMTMVGWKVYGYKPDRRDIMMDYYDPADWSGLAEKNGYILCVNIDYKGSRETIEWIENGGEQTALPTDLKAKIAKLEAVTMKRGATLAEEETAKAMIQKLLEKAVENKEWKKVVVDHIPEHMENPSRMNWHIEKDGVYIAKGNGILKFSGLNRAERNRDDIQEYTKDKDAYFRKLVKYYMDRKYYKTEEDAVKSANENIENLEKDIKLLKEFDKFINKIDMICGGMLGKGDGIRYEKVMVTEYKEELKAVETTEGELAEGQCFILKVGFNADRYEGLVYRIHTIKLDNGKLFYSANKLNGKLTKECTKMASQNNYWRIGSREKECNKFLDFINKWWYIAWCNLEKVRTPYTVEKVVKKNSANKTSNV